jgi:hypothetical protein
MPEIVKETTTVTENNQAPVAQKSVKRVVKSEIGAAQYIEYVLYFLVGVLEVLLGFRFVLKFMGASQASGFVRFVYNSSSVFIMPFEGIFRRGVMEGIETVSVIEPSTIVAFIVYPLIAFGVVTLIRILMGQVETE